MDPKTAEHIMWTFVGMEFVFLCFLWTYSWWQGRRNRRERVEPSDETDRIHGDQIHKRWP